jgi:hypothetical protein
MGSLVVMSCLGCTNPQAADVIKLSVGPVPDNQAYEENDQQIRGDFAVTRSDLDYLPTPRVGNDFSITNFAPTTGDEARFSRLDLSTPAPIRQMSGDSFGGEFSFSASGAPTGLGVDLQFAPRYQVQQDRAGQNALRTGAEFRVGQNLEDRDLRRTDARSPSWYFFVGADNEALVWNVADPRAMDGLTLYNQATVGDLQAGIAFTMAKGDQLSFGMVERSLKYNDPTGDNDVRRKDRFAAFTYTLKH